MRVIDAEGRVLGRLSVEIVKLARKGEDIAVVNAEKAVVSGRMEAAVSKYMIRHQRGNPQHGPFFPRGPEGIVRRAVRGMIGYRTEEGKAAFARVKVYAGIPEELKAHKAEKLGKGVENLDCEFTFIGELSKHLGYYYANEK